VFYEYHSWTNRRLFDVFAALGRRRSVAAQRLVARRHHEGKKIVIMAMHAGRGSPKLLEN